MTSTSIAQPKAGLLAVSVPWKVKFFFITILNLCCFAALWELVTIYGHVPSAYLPKLTAVFADFPRMMAEGILLPNLWVSVSNYLIGLVIGVGLGLPLAFAVGGIKFLDGAHFLIACAFCAFLFTHAYLATLGHTPLAHFKPMWTGWEEVEGH